MLQTDGGASTTILGKDQASPVRRPAGRRADSKEVREEGGKGGEKGRGNG